LKRPGGTIQTISYACGGVWSGVAVRWGDVVVAALVLLTIVMETRVTIFAPEVTLVIVVRFGQMDHPMTIRGHIVGVVGKQTKPPF
jgi:hypothetical protein